MLAQAFRSVCVVALVSVVLWGSSASAAINAAFGTDYNLSDVIAAGGIRVDDMVFGNFLVTTNKTSGALAPGASGISVRAIQVDGDYGLAFNGGWSALGGQTADTTIKFSVTADAPMLIKDNLLKLTAFAADKGGMVSVSENVYTADPDVTTTAPIANEFAYYVSDATNRLADHKTFAPVTTIWVEKDVIANGGTDPNGIAHLSQFDQTFSHAPEPVTLALLGLGGLAMLSKRKRR